MVFASRKWTWNAEGYTRKPVLFHRSDEQIIRNSRDDRYSFSGGCLLLFRAMGWNFANFLVQGFAGLTNGD